MKKSLMPAVLLALLPATLLAQTPEERIESARVRVQSAGIPVSLLESKITEGKAMGVDMTRIAAAIERRAEGLARAKAAVAVDAGSKVDDATLVAGADALAAGVSEEILRAVSEVSPSDRRAVAIASLTALVQAGHVPAEALARVTEAVGRGSQALRDLPAEAAVAQGRASQPPARGGAPTSVPAAGTAPTGAPATIPTAPKPPARRPGS